MLPNNLLLLVAAGLSDRAIGERMGVSARTVLRWRQRDGIASRWAPERAPHGTVSAYSAGCRCDRCRRAHRDAQRYYRAHYARTAHLRRRERLDA